MKIVQNLRNGIFSEKFAKTLDFLCEWWYNVYVNS